MATLYTHQESNNAKTLFLMVFLFSLIIAVGWFLSFYFNNRSILYGAVVFSVVLNFFSYWYSDTVALKMAKAEEIGPQNPEYVELRRIVENLCITAGLPIPRLYLVQDQVPNAFATGRNKNHSAIAVTTGLLRILDRSELEGVLAHELSHIGNKDILISTIAVVLAGFLSIASDIFLRSTLFGGFGARDGQDNRGGISIIIGFILILLAPLAGLLIRLAISRKREFLADASGALLTRNPEGLAKALEKISAHAEPMATARDATAHLYISSPFGGLSGKGIHGLFMTHPPVEERIAMLRSSAK